MQRILFITVLVISLMIAGIVMAAPKVVVIPLGSGGATGPSGLPGMLISIYDDDNTFLGYKISGTDYSAKEFGGNTYITALKQYPAHFDPWGPQLTHYNEVDIYSPTPNCTGSNYVIVEPDIVGNKGRPGTIITHRVIDLISTTEIYYIPIDSPPLSLPNPLYFKAAGSDTSTCELASPTIATENTFYQILINNPTITGYENIYTDPVREVLTLPPAP